MQRKVPDGSARIPQPVVPKISIGESVLQCSEVVGFNRKGVLSTFKRNSFGPFISKYTYAMIAAIVDFSL